MKARDRVQAALQCQKPDRIPWVPFVGCHAGALIGRTAREYLQSRELMVEGLQAAIERYRPDGIPVSFDLQIEAEALGCELVWADENPPSVAGHVLLQGVSLEDLKPLEAGMGRIPLVMGATRCLRRANPDLSLYGLLTGPFTLALHLLGTDIFMKMFDDPDYVRKLMEYCTDAASRMSSAFIEAGCDVVAVVDPMTSQIGPEQFREFVTPHMTAVFDHIRKEGALGSFFVCGHAQQNILAMCECRPHNVSIDENIPLDDVRSVCLPRGISFGGNMQLTSVLLLGTAEDSQRNALACMEVAGDTGYLLAPGCDLPYGTPPANLEAVMRIALDPYERDVIRAKAATKTSADLLDLSEYGNSDKIIVDIVTLDSEACAPCQYMVEAVRKVTPEFEGIVEWREHKIKYRESLVFMTSLMVRNVPTICIDGQITFVSRIPARDELIAAIQRRINEKMRTKIQQRKASIYILGDGGAECQRIRANTEKAIKELGADVDIVEVADPQKIYAYGISPVMLPAVVVARYQVKTTRVIPEPAIIKEWIKDV
jgi:MtaA/CmuA family methyltransferase